MNKDHASSRRQNLPGKPQYGLTLVELMIALLLSTFLLGGLMNMGISAKDSYRFQQAKIVNQEASRYTGYYLNYWVSRAGLASRANYAMMLEYPATPATASCEAFADEQIVANGKLGVGICLRTQRDRTGVEIDCSGNAVNDNKTYSMVIYFDSTDNTLKCSARGAAATTLVENIEEMRFTYAVSNTKSSRTDNDWSATSYTSNPPNWTKILAVRFSFLTASDAEILSEPQDYYFPLDATSTTEAEDKRAYQSSQRTISVRNAVL